MNVPTFAEQVAELKREIALRGRVFPKWVAAGKMKQTQADHRIACLEATLSYLEDSANFRLGNG